jgi:hypothetical protein
MELMVRPNHPGVSGCKRGHTDRQPTPQTFFYWLTESLSKFSKPVPCETPRRIPTASELNDQSATFDTGTDMIAFLLMGSQGIEALHGRSGLELQQSGSRNFHRYHQINRPKPTWLVNGQTDLTS